MICDVCAQHCEDRSFASLDLAVDLRLIGRRKVVLYWHDLTHVNEELGRKISAVVSCEFLRRNIVEYPRIAEEAVHFRRKQYVHRDGLGHITGPVCNSKQVLVLPLSLYEIAQYVYIY